MNHLNSQLQIFLGTWIQSSYNYFYLHLQSFSRIMITKLTINYEQNLFGCIEKEDIQV